MTTRPHSLSAVAGWPFLITAFLGRMPAAMVQLGYLLIMSHSGHGYAAGGLAVAAVGLGSAVAAPILGRLVDRFGALPILGAATVVSLLAQLAFLGMLRADGPTGALLAWAAVVGAANPQVGAVARSRWSQLATQHDDATLISRALGWEGAADETGFVIGPVAASLLVSALGATRAAVGIFAATLLLQGLFLAYLARDRHAWSGTGATPPPSSRPESISVQALWPMLAVLGVGTVFGATQTGLTVMLTDRGQSGLTGLIYGLVGVGSGTASLLVGRLSARIGIPWRVLAGALVMLAGGALFATLPPAGLAAFVALLLGVGAGTTLVSGFTWMERIAPAGRLATMMTVLSTCITLGVSGGAAAAGRLSDVPAHAFWPLAAAGILGIAAAAGMAATRRRDARRASEPARTA